MNKLVDDEVKKLLSKNMDIEEKENENLKDIFLSKENHKDKKKIIKKNIRNKYIVKENNINNYINDSIYNKNAKWIDNKVNKLENDKKIKNNNLNFSYKPKINKNIIYKKDYVKNNGVDKFLERQKKANLEKLRKKEILSSNNSSYINTKYLNNSKNIINRKKFIRNVLEIAPVNYKFDNKLRNQLEGKKLAENINSLHKYLNTLKIENDTNRKINIYK